MSTDRGMTAEEKVIYILRRSFHETPNDAAMMHIARSIIGALTDPPTDDEREGLDEVIRRNWVATPGEFRNALMASDVWRNRHRGPITDEMVEAAYRTLPQRKGEVSLSVMRVALEAARKDQA